MKIKRAFKKRKGEVGVSFRRVGKMINRNLPGDKNEKIKALCFNVNPFTYLKLIDYMQQNLEGNPSELPICVVGDAKIPPLPFQVFRYYLVYNPENFIGSYQMRLYGDNCFLTFLLNYPEDFDKIKEIAHRTVYLGSLCRILLVCANDAVLPQKRIKDEMITDYDIVILKDADHYLPFNKSSDLFEFMIPKKL